MLPQRSRRHQARPGTGCDVRRSGGNDKGRELAFPSAPGITARRLDQLTVLVAYRVAARDPRCPPNAIQVTVDVNEDPLPGVNTIATINGRRGRLRVVLPEALRSADVVRARTRTHEGLPSEATSVLIR